MGNKSGLGTGNTAREVMGKGGIINPKHEGPVTRRPAEDYMSEWGSGSSKTPADLRNEKLALEMAARESKQAKLAAEEAELARIREDAREAAATRRRERESRSSSERQG